MDTLIKTLVEQGGWAVFGALALYLVVQSWKLRIEDKDEMIDCLKASNEKLMAIAERLSEAIGRNTDVISRNNQALEEHTEAFKELRITLGRLNGKSQP